MSEGDVRVTMVDEPEEAVVPSRGAAVRRLVFLMAGQGVSSFGDAFFTVALPVLVLVQHGASALGVVLAVYGAFRLLGLTIGGPLADRIAPRWVMMLSDCVRAPTAGLLGVLAWHGHAGLWIIAACAAVLGVAGGAFLPADFALLPQMVQGDRLQRATSLNYGVAQVAALVGPIAAGALVANDGPGPAVLVDALTYVISVVTLCFVRSSRGTAADPRSDTEPRPSLRAVLRESPLFRVIGTAAVVAALGSSGVLEVGIPARLKESGSLAAGYGPVMAAFALGAVLGSLAVLALPSARLPGGAAFLLVIPQAALFVVAGAVHGVLPMALIFVGAGVANAAGNVLLMTQVQQNTPAESRGRVTGALLTAVFGMAPVSALLAGVVAVQVGSAAVFFAGGGLLVLSALVGLSSPYVRSLKYGQG